MKRTKISCIKIVATTWDLDRIPHINTLSTPSVSQNICIIVVSQAGVINMIIDCCVLSGVPSKHSNVKEKCSQRTHSQLLQECKFTFISCEFDILVIEYHGGGRGLSSSSRVSVFNLH